MPKGQTVFMLFWTTRAISLYGWGGQSFIATLPMRECFYSNYHSVEFTVE